MRVLDHTTPEWILRQKRTNGAETYSADLVKYQIPKLRAVLPTNTIVSTCPRFSSVRVNGTYDLAVQYLHTFPYNDPLTYVRRIKRRLPFRAKKFIFITAYKQFETIMRRAGYNAVYIPMSIDVEAMREFAETDDQSRPEHRIVWFGNVTKEKAQTYVQVQNAADKLGYKCDVISRMRFNSSKDITQQEAWQIVEKYRYAVAVGRCALECFGLGLKVLIAGREVGGLVMNNADKESQIETNFNARYPTYSNNIEHCLQTLDRSKIVEPLNIRTMDHAAMLTNKYG